MNKKTTLKLFLFSMLLCCACDSIHQGKQKIGFSTFSTQTKADLKELLHLKYFIEENAALFKVQANSDESKKAEELHIQGQTVIRKFIRDCEQAIEDEAEEIKRTLQEDEKEVLFRYEDYLKEKVPSPKMIADVALLSIEALLLTIETYEKAKEKHQTKLKEQLNKIQWENFKKIGN
jgi:hypothetical protein